MIGIWRYTEKEWGREQADRYLAGIDATIGILVKSDTVGRELEFVRSGLRKLRCKRHFVYFRVSTDRFEIVRVLHERQDETLHLS